MQKWITSPSLVLMNDNSLMMLYIDKQGGKFFLCQSRRQDILKGKTLWSGISIRFTWGKHYSGGTVEPTESGNSDSTNSFFSNM